MPITCSLCLTCISPCPTLEHRYETFWMLCVLSGHLLPTKEVLFCCVFSVRYLAKLSSVGSIRDEETCERLRGLIQRQVRACYLHTIMYYNPVFTTPSRLGPQWDCGGFKVFKAPVYSSCWSSVSPPVWSRLE